MPFFGCAFFRRVSASDSDASASEPRFVAKGVVTRIFLRGRFILDFLSITVKGIEQKWGQGATVVAVSFERVEPPKHLIYKYCITWAFLSRGKALKP